MPRTSRNAPQHSSAPRVVVIARLKSGEVGGIQQATACLAASLGKLIDGEEEYVVVTDERDPGWLDAYVGANSRVVTYSEPKTAPFMAGRVLARGPRRPYAVARRIYRSLAVTHVARAERRNAFIDGLAPDVVHFPYQEFYPTNAPSLFNPHDVQHLHFPEFFTREELHERGRLFGAWCARATAIEVPSRQTKRDLVRLLNVPESKIYVVQRASPTTLLPVTEEPAPAQLRRRFGLPSRFVYYPAQTWPHKNHIRLLRAMALLRDRGQIVNLVFTGHQNSFWPTISREIRRLDLDQQVRALGFIPTEDARALYHMATFTVFPTLFEGGGFPAVEALAECCALTCSDLPVLLEQVDDAAHFFDPSSEASIAAALRRLDSDPQYRRELTRRGSNVTRSRSWDRTARTYRSLYRKLSGAPLQPMDEELLRAAAASGNLRPDSESAAGVSRT